MKHSKSPLAIAILLALSSNVFAAPGAICPGGVCEGPITQQAEVNDILFNDDKTTLTFKGNDGFDVGLSNDDLTRISKIEGKGDVTIKGNSTVINHTGPSNVNIYGMKNLTIESDNVDGKATINLTGSDNEMYNHDEHGELIASKKLIFGHAPGKDMTEGQYLDSLTITAKNGNAFTVKPEERHDGKLDVRIRAKKVLIETEAKDGIAVEANGNYGLKKGYADFAFGYSEDNDGNELGLPEDKDRDITLKSPNLALLATNEGGFIVEASGGELKFEGSVEVSKNGWLEAGWGNPDHLEWFPKEWIEGENDEETEYYAARYLDRITLLGTKDSALKVENGGLVTLAAEDIFISKAKDGKSAIEILSTEENLGQKSNVVDIHATKNLTINGDINLDLTKGLKDGYINIASDGITLINGNINTINRDDTDGKVFIDIEGPQSIFTGSVNDTFVKSEVATLSLRDNKDKNGTYLGLKNGATWNATGKSSLGSLVSDDGVVNIKQAATIAMDRFESKNTLVTYDNRPDEKIEKPLFEAKVASGTVRGQFKQKLDASDEEFVDAANKFFGVPEGSGLTPTSVSETEGLTGDGRELTTNEDGSQNLIKHSNTVSSSISDIASTQMLAWRSQINDVNKRLGDLRTYEGNIGSWVRVFGGKSEFGDRDLENKYTTVQLGADTKVMNNFYVGMTAHYTDGEGTIINGSTEDQSYGFGVYGGWLADNGQFVDVIVKRTRMDTDFDLHYTNGDKSTGSFDTWGTSVSVEYGWRLNSPSTKFWVEPQVELSYGHLEGVDYTTSVGVRAKQDSMDSLIGRFGVAVGGTFDMGSAYVKASVAHEFDGESSVVMTSNNGNPDHLTEDLGGTFWKGAVVVDL